MARSEEGARARDFTVFGLLWRSVALAFVQDENPALPSSLANLLNFLALANIFG
jgi:hypothetical protein